MVAAVPGHAARAAATIGVAGTVPGIHTPMGSNIERYAVLRKALDACIAELNQIVGPEK